MSTILAGSLEPFEPRGRALMDVHPQDDGTDDDNLASSVLSNSPKVSAKSLSSAYSSLKQDELWTIREVANGEEQLYSRGKSVYWTRNSLIIKSFNFTDFVVKAFWSKLSNCDHICVALNSGLSIFNKSGQHFQIPLQFAYKEIYASQSSIIIERQRDIDDDSSMPLLFALTHPSQEISPILFRPITKGSHGIRTYLAQSVSDQLSITACHPTLPLCLMYNSQDCQHSIWRIRRATQDEIDEYHRMNDEQTATSTTFANYQSSCSFRDGTSHGNSLNISSKQHSSLLHQTSNPSSANTINFSPKMDLRSKHSVLGNLAASRLGIGATQNVADVNSATLRSFNSFQSMSSLPTPNKNRIINYLRDNIEEPVMPELALEQLWIESSNNSAKANKFFSTNDLVGDEYIVIVIWSSNILKVIKCDKLDGKDIIFGRAVHISAIDAMPIPAMKMMIVVDFNKSISLYSGFDKVTTVRIPQQPTPGVKLSLPPYGSPTSLKSSVEMSPIQASSARKRISVGEHNSMSSESSFQMFHALSPVPHASKHHESKTSSPVSSSDIKRIEHVIGRTIYVISNTNQRATFEIPPVYQTPYVRRLLDSMNSLVSKDLALAIIAGWYRSSREKSLWYVMRADEELITFKKWFLNVLGVRSFIFDSDYTIGEITYDSVYLSPNKKTRRAKDMDFNPILANVHSLFFAMHLIFEDLLLMKLNYQIAYQLVELLIVLACLLRLTSYQDYYWLKFPDWQEKYGPLRARLEGVLPKLEHIYKPPYFQQDPPSVMDFLDRIVSKAQLNNDDHLKPYPIIAGVTNYSHTVISIFAEMFQIGRNQALINITSSTPSNARTNIFDKRHPSRSRKADEKVVELLAELGKSRNYLSRLPEGINLYIWDAILNCRESPPSHWNEACFSLIGRMDLVNLVCGRTKSINFGRDLFKDSEDETLKLIFPDDIRVSETHRMLNSDTPVEFSVTQRPGATEEESRDETHRHLYLLNVRTMGMPVGRGAACLRTYSPVIGETFEVPRLELSGRLISEDRSIEYTHDISVYPWPFFHNGVAAGLTICASTANNIIDSTWINYNRPRSNIPHGLDMRDRDLTAANINNEHAGFLFALGLNGHLEKLSLMALHDYLCQNNDLTKLAILLGMSAAKRGSRDNNIIKVLSIHVDALLPPNSTELDVPAPVHAAAIIGVGLLYQGSSDSHISKVLLEEIGRLPGPETNSHIDRESYSLSAGLAFGLVNLCKGGSSTISSSDQLRLYMLGGKRKPLTIGQRARYFKQDCHRGEEEYINTHITSPGGTLGLGLMYHRSGNQSVANWMRAPETQTLLEYVRPDFLILRILSYGLIMWNEIEPSEDWINSHIPKIVSTHAFQKNSSPAPTRFGVSTNVNNQTVDYELISQAYCNIVAGCCMAIAMRYAGSAHRDAYKTIYKHTKMLIALSNKPILAEQAGRPCIELCLNVLVTSLAVVMAGTGDLGVMRVCRYLRSRLAQSFVFYGSYMAVHMSLGILFLGSCRYSLSSSPEAIGALVCALYPIYPNHSSDNRYHLQALRHLYVLAAEPRLIIPRDIQTNKPVYAKITVEQYEEARNGKNKSQVKTLKLKAPCLVPEVETIKSISVDDDRYWRMEISDKDALVGCLLRDQGYLSVKQKAHSSNNQLVQNIETYILQNMSPGVMKSRKQAALSDCVKEDRVEQYSALNELLTQSDKVQDRFGSLRLEQIRLANTLAAPLVDNVSRKNNDLALNKMHLLKPVIAEFEKKYLKIDIESKWTNYIAKTTDWTNTDPNVAHYITLNGLKCFSHEEENELLKTLRQLDMRVSSSDDDDDQDQDQDD